MLNKEICIKCWNKAISWTETDDRRWNRGEIICPWQIDKKDINKKIPNECKYKLEHILKEYLID